MGKTAVQLRAGLTINPNSTPLFNSFPAEHQPVERRQSSSGPGHLVHELPMAPIKDILWVMSIPYEGRPQNVLSLSVCLLQLIITNTGGKQTVVSLLSNL